MWRKSLTLALVACSVDLPNGAGFIEPLDGQDAVPLDATLRIAGAAEGLPPDADLPRSLVQVLDVGRGGLVPGMVERAGADLVFEPEEAWRPGSDYHWHIAEVTPQPRGTAWSLGAPLAGGALFSTRDRARVLSTVDGLDGLCLVMSRPLTELPEILSERDGVPVDIAWTLLDESSFHDLDLTVSPPVAVVCADLDEPRGLLITVDGEVAPPAEPGAPADILHARRRDGS